MRQLIIEYPHPRYPHYPQQKPAPSPVGEGWGEGSKPKACLPASENVQYLVAESISGLLQPAEYFSDGLDFIVRPSEKRFAKRVRSGCSCSGRLKMREETMGFQAV